MKQAGIQARDVTSDTCCTCARSLDAKDTPVQWCQSSQMDTPDAKPSVRQQGRESLATLHRF